MDRLTRRRFLIASGVVGAGALVAGATAYTLREILATAGDAALPAGARRLVVITLYGGNDGLATVIPFADPRSGELFRDAKGIPLGLLGVKPVPGHTGGACAADRSLDTLLMNDLDRASSKPFRLLRRE